MRYKKWEHKKWMGIGCVFVGITFAFLGAFVDNFSTGLQDGNKLTRNTYGQGETEEEIVVEGLLQKKVPITVVLGEREYGREEAEAAFTPAYEVLMTQVLGNNKSFDEIRTNLNLPTWVNEYEMKVEWESEHEELLHHSGELFNKDCPPNGMENHMTVCLTAGQYSRKYIIKTVVYPPSKTEEELAIAAFKEQLFSLDVQQKTKGELTLPKQYDGKKLSYKMKKNSIYWVFPILGLMIAILIPLKERQDKQEERKKRERQLLLDYSEVVSKLVVFLGAGLPIRKAWEQIVTDYEEKIQNEAERRCAYEEMKNAYYLMNRGVSEMRAYEEFGNRCRILPYRKLAGILEQNIKNGTGNIGSILEIEMQEAFEQRKILARRMGEEAGTKLLLPLFMMLSVVMVIISMPAFLSFGF
ncbi:MAG: hypothetical protein RR242_04160 [Clostridium sp.]